MFKVTIKKNIDWHEVVYVIIMIGCIYAAFATGINLGTLIVIDGAIVKFSSVIFTPIWLHLKCVYYDRSSGYVEGD
jgi:hypothetical protein